MIIIAGKKWLKFSYLLCISCLFTATSAHAAITLKLTDIDGTQLQQAQAGKPFVAHVLLTHTTNTTQYPEIAGLENFKVSKNGFHMNMINGDTSISYRYQIRIDNPGTYVIGPAKMQESNHVLESAPVTITVAQEEKVHEQKKDTAAKASSSFIRLTCDKQEVFVGQKVPCSLTFYTTDPAVTLQGLIEPDAQESSGYTMKNKKGPLTGTQKMNGVEHRYAQWQWDLYPTKAGTVIIPAYAANYISQTSGSMFSFFLGHAQSKKVYSNSARITVHPLPDTDQKVFFVGTIQDISAKIEPAGAKVGEGMVLTMSLSGEGNFDTFSFLPLSHMPEHSKWYESKSFIEPSKTPGLSTLNMEYIVQALAPGTYQIPSQEFRYFDIQEHRYKSRTTVPLTIQVFADDKPALTIKKITTSSIETPDAHDILPLNSNAHSIPLWPALLPWNVLWLGIFLLTFVWSLGMIWCFKRHWLRAIWPTQDTNKIYKRAQEQIKMAARMGDHQNFYTIFINFLSAHFTIDPTQITPEILDARLAQAGLSLVAIADWKIFFSKLVELKFYPKTTDAYAYDHIKDQSLYWIDVLQKLPRENR